MNPTASPSDELRIVRWVTWDQAFDKMPELQTDQHYMVLLETIRRDGLKFDGFDHQDARGQGIRGVPVFSDGRVWCSTMRGWGEVMSEVWDDEFNYTSWAWFMPDGVERKLPPQTEAADGTEQ